jgi:transposase-like protein
LLSELTKQVLETGLEVEMEEHLGYEEQAAEGRDNGNSRNGTRSKTVITEVGPVDLAVPVIVTVRSNTRPRRNVSGDSTVSIRWSSRSPLRDSRPVRWKPI